MKRTISLFLCLIMCFSVFSSVAVPVSALGVASQLFSVKSGAVKDGQITFTVTMNGGVEAFGGAVVLIEYDNTVLVPAEEGFEAACSSSGVPNFNGFFEDGTSTEGDNFYSVGYMNMMPEKVNTNKDFFKLTFDIIDDTRPATGVNFYCKEFYSTTDAEQSITVQDGLQTIAKLSGIITLEVPQPESATLITNGIVFKWKEVIGATSYEIYRMTPTGAWGEAIAVVSAGENAYTDYNLESGNTYLYTVKAVNDSGATLRNSKTVSCRYISKPTNITVESGIGGIDITWDKAYGVDKYQIVRREFGADEWEVIAEPTNLKTTYKDTTIENGKTYEYDVNSILGSFVTDIISDGEYVTYLTSPAISSVTNISEGIELIWENVENAAYYVVYRKAVGVETEFSEYANVTSNYFVDTDVQTGKAYTYSVQAISNFGDESAFTKTGYTITRVPATVVTEIVPQADGIKVSWEAIDGVDGYYIYRKTEASDWEKAGGVGKTLTTFEDKSAKSGQTYIYCVTPCIGTSQSAKVPSFQSVYYLKTPQNVIAVNIKDAIKVNWSASAGATVYHIYRQDGLTTASYLVGTVDAGETEFIDTNVDVDGVYYYYVKAVNEANGEESFNSEITPAVKRIECVEKIKTDILSNGVLITWREHIFADSYIIYRKTNGVWEKIAETDNFEYVDESVVSGETYGYSVAPVVDEFEGGIDETAVQEFKYLTAPFITEAELTTDSIKVSWEKVSGAKTYQLQRVVLDSDGDISGSYSIIATVNADKSSYEDTKVKAGQRYNYRIYAVDGEEKSLVSETYKATFLATQSVKSLANAYGGVKITWSGNTGAKNYRVYRKVSGGEWVFVKKLSSSTRSYTDKGAENGVKTYYAVKAQNGDSISTYKAKSFTYFASPKVEVENRTSAITVTWDKISGAKSYYVYRKGPGDSSWKKVSTVTKNIYTDSNVKNGKYYRYTVKAYNGEIFSAYNTDGWRIKRLSAPKLKSIKNSTSGVTLEWSKVTGASKYIVMRKQSGSSKWEEIKTTTSLSYTDKTAKAGKIYTYSVKAGYSDYRSIYVADGLKIKRMSRPGLESVKSSKSGVTFKWNTVTGASGYYVYRKTGTGDWEQLAKVTGSASSSYVDKTAKKGKTYYYSVRAYSGSYKSAYNTNGLKIKDKY